VRNRQKKKLRPPKSGEGKLRTDEHKTKGQRYFRFNKNQQQKDAGKDLLESGGK